MNSRLGLVNRLEWIFVIGLFSIPILQRGYDIGVWSNIFIILMNILAILIVVLKNKGILSKFIWVRVSAIITVIITLSFFSALQPYRFTSSSSSINNLIILTDSIIIFGLVANGALEGDKLVKLYDICAKCAIIFLFMQIFVYYSTHVILSGRFPFLALEVGLSDRSFLANLGYVRASSFFIEPSYYAQFMAPYLALSLYGYKNIIKKNIVWSILISISMVLNVSGSSVLLLLIIWGAYVVMQSKSMSRTQAISLLALVILLMVGMMAALRLPGVSAMLEGIFDSSGGKFSGRVTRGFSVFFELPFFEKLFGIGFKNITNAINYFNLDIVTLSRANEYCNTIATFLLSFGLIGSCVIAVILYQLTCKKNSSNKIVWITIISIFCSEEILGFLWLFYMCIGYAANQVRMDIN